MSGVFFSQQGEDLFVLKNYINKMNTTGVFVEVGALDGITYSNTAFLENCLGFSGILIEPSRYFKRLRGARPDCVCVNKAISDTAGEAVFRDNWAMSGLLDKLSDVHRTNTYHGPGECYIVQTVPLGKLLHENKIKYVDFISIDVEGGELEVLRSMDWDIPTYIICIELDGHNTTKDEECRNILKSKGFRLDKRVIINEFWVNDSYFRKDDLFDVYKPYVDWKNISSLDECGRFLFMEQSAIPSVYEAIFN